MIRDAKLRHLIQKFSQRGITEDEKNELIGYCRTSDNSFLLKLMTLLVGESKASSTRVYSCPAEWKNFIHSIASSSPACALIPPSEESGVLVDRICSDDITKKPEVSATNFEYIVIRYYYRICSNYKESSL